MKYQKSIHQTTGVSFLINLISIAVFLFTTVNSASAIELRSYCQMKADFAGDVFDSRNVYTKNEMLEATEQQWHNTDSISPWYIVVDMQRVINDVYRKNGVGNFKVIDKKKLMLREKWSCIRYGF